MPTYDFEDGLVPTVFLQQNLTPFTNSTDGAPPSGTRTFKSGLISDNEITWFCIFGDFDAGDFDCDYKISSESGFDYGYILIQDGTSSTQIIQVSGAGSWSSIPTQTLSAGIHLIFFCYIKDNGASSGDDAFYIDNLTVPSFTDLKSKLETFPSGVPGGWTNDATNPWVLDSQVNGIKSPTIADSVLTQVSYSSPSSSPAGNMYMISFADSELNFDFLTLDINASQVYSDSGQFFNNSASTLRAPLGHSQAVSSGTVDYDFKYETDGGLQQGTSAGYVILFFEPSFNAASSTPLIVQDIDQDQSIGNVNLIQSNVLLVSEISQSQSIDAASFIQHNLISCGDLAQAEFIENVELTQANILIVSDLNQSNSAEVSTFIQNNNLSVISLNNNQSISNALLSIADNLLVNDLSQNNNIDNSELIQQNILLVAGLNHPQLLSNSSFTQANLLSVNSLSGQQLLSAVSFDGVVVGKYKGEIVVVSGYNGDIVMHNALTGKLILKTAYDGEI